MKYSLFTVSVPDLKPEQTLQKMKEYGYDGIDWRVTTLPTDPEVLGEKPSYWRNNLCTIDINTLEDSAEEIKGLADKYGICINSLATYLSCNDSEECIASCMRAAKKMGCKKIRINTPAYDPEKNYQEIFAQALIGFGKVEKLAKQYGVKADFEMHMGNITPSASAAKHLASYFDPEYIGVIYDTGNVIYEGYEEYKMAFEILGSYLDLVHVKNAKWERTSGEENGKYAPCWAPITDGYADFEKCFKALKQCGYDGYVVFEDFSGEDSSDKKMKENIQYIRNIVKAIESGEGKENE